MIQTPAIVTFANQKGGVGKTTLCVTFANYLVTKGARVIIVDCDFQHSIAKCRRRDIRKYGEELSPYDVLEYEATDKDKMTVLMERLHNEPGIDVVLIDSPGSLKAGGLASVFANSDILVVPFHYDLVTIPSTSGFLMFIEKLREKIGGRMKAKVFLVPNQHDARVGKRSELVIWDQAREAFSNHGYVTPKVPKRVDMGRFSTIAALDRQRNIVAPIFDKIYLSIFDKTEPVREISLTGIQLTENYLAGLKKPINENGDNKQPEQ